MLVALVLVFTSACTLAGDDDKPTSATKPAPDLPADLRQLVTKYCFDCHADGAEEGGLALDKLASRLAKVQGDSADHAQWISVWKNLRAQMMPPADEKEPAAAEREALVHWIERDVLRLDPAHPDPGRVTIRRLNRIEYTHTIRDLFGVEFDAAESFPADDTGYGFDTIGDVLTMSPLLMEKYLEAAQTIVMAAVPPGGPQRLQSKLRERDGSP